jgi:hypothetical protein
MYEEVLPTVVSHLHYMIAGKLHKTFDYHGTPAPWIQLHCLEIIELIQSNNLGYDYRVCNICPIHV